MKWGVRRYQSKDGKLTSAGKKRYSSTAVASTSQASRDHSRSDKSELAKLSMNVIADLMTLNPVGAALDIARLSQAGESYVKSKIYDKEREGCKVDMTTRFRLKEREMSIKQDAVRVNAAVHNFDSNTKNNCMLCTATYDLRRRGYEVKAKKASYGYLSEEFNAWYPNAKLNKITGLNEKGKPSVSDMITKTKTELVKQGNGARGNLMVTWRGMRGGHSVAYEIVNDKLMIVDAQIGKIYNNPDSLLRKCSNEIEYMRLDDTTFDRKTIREVAE
jgi:hypothetical protein